MKIGIILFASVVTLAAGDRIPDGFVPLPPIPYGGFKPKTPPPPMTPSTLKIFTPKTKAPPKTTPAPITKKPVTVKTNKPLATKAPPHHISTRTTTQNCQLTFNVPNSNCQGGNSVVQQTLSSLRQQLSTTRQQHQSQNAALQSIISQLQSQQSGYLTKIADLQNEVQTLVAAFNSLPSGQIASTLAPGISPRPTSSSGNTAVLKQDIQNIKLILRNAMNDFEAKIFNLSVILNQNQIQESKLHQTLDAQILKQTSEISRLNQEVKDLTRQLQQVQSNTTGSGSAITKGEFAKLKSQIQQVSTEIQQYDRQQQSRINNLTSASSSLQTTVNQQASDIRNAKNSAQLTFSRLGVAEKDITKLHDDFAKFRQTREPQIIQLDKDVKELTKNLTTINTGFQQIQRTTLKFAQQTTKNSQELLPLKLTSVSLKTNVTQLNQDLSNQRRDIASLQQGLVNLKNTVSLQDLNNLNNVILQIINNNPVSQQSLTTLKNSLQTLQNRLQALHLAPVSG